MAHCAHCGTELLETGHCPNCGQPVASPPETRPPALQSLPLGDYFRRGWELFKGYPGGFVGFFLLYVLLAVVINAAPLVGWVVGAALGPPLLMGNFIVSARLLQGQKVEFQDFFTAFHFWLPLCLTGFATSVLVGVGFLLLIIPGVYLAVGYLFASLLVVDRRLDFWQAMETSRRTVQPLWFGLFTFALLLLLLNLAGALLLGLGLLVTVPLTFCILTVAYGDIMGFHSDYGEKIPRLT
jgi:uncharacterized membrane protein